MFVTWNPKYSKRLHGRCRKNEERRPKRPRESWREQNRKQEEEKPWRPEMKLNTTRKRKLPNHRLYLVRKLLYGPLI